MKYISIVLGILGFIFMFPGLIPCLGWLNWINLFFSSIGLIIALYLYQSNEVNRQDNNVKIALYLNGCAFVVGGIRLFLGSGII